MGSTYKEKLEYAKNMMTMGEKRNLLRNGCEDEEMAVIIAIDVEAFYFREAQFRSKVFCPDYLGSKTNSIWARGKDASSCNNCQRSNAVGQYGCPLHIAQGILAKNKTF